MTSEESRPAEKQSLRRRFASGAMWSLAMRVVLRILGPLTVIVVAHGMESFGKNSAGEFGILALVMIVISFLGNFVNLGVGANIIRSRFDDQVEEKRSLDAAFWLSMFLAATSALLVILIADPVSDMIAPSVDFAWPLRIVAVSWLLSPFWIVTSSLLQREMRFDLNFRIQVASEFAASAMCVIGVFAGLGWEALVLQLYTRIVLLAYLGSRYTAFRPGLYTSKAHMRRHFEFGYPLALSAMMTWVSDTIDDVFIGRKAGYKLLGPYDRAYDWAQAPRRFIGHSVMEVIFPLMAEVKDDRPRLKFVFLRGMSLLTTMMFPVATLIALEADRITETLLPATPEWALAAKYLPILAAQSAIIGVVNMFGRVQLVYGATRLMAKLLFVQLVFLFAMLFAIWLNWSSFAPEDGIVYVACAQAASLALMLPIFMNVIRWHIDVRALDVVKSIAPALIASAAGGGWLVLMKQLSVPDSGFAGERISGLARMTFECAGFGIVTLLASVCLSGGLWKEFVNGMRK
ncbi:MAG: oligosaccharide flippase family protein [Planctomycetes bacterium]|nr:oligosaccharide flippase family protein [Planctomycetota bacterium]